MGAVRTALTGLVLLACSGAFAADGELLSREAFLSQACGDAAPVASSLWLTGETGRIARQILGHEPDSLRLRYWRCGPSTAWIIDEIGKERPITIGVIVDDGAIRAVRILAYREPRGWEVQHAFFLDQFQGLMRRPQGGLTGRIDGIAGATLSVHAVRRVAELALALHRQVDTP